MLFLWFLVSSFLFFFFFQAEDGIRDWSVTGVQTCALPISRRLPQRGRAWRTTGAMIERVIEYSARNRFLVLVLTAAALVGATWAVRNIPVDAIPDLSDTQVIVY